jgi:alkylation response protein AidB-like acyl-CoA dehydrogenase
MDFSLSQKELDFAREVGAWLDANLPSEWRRDRMWTRADDPEWVEVARRWQKRLFEGGWAAISWPPADGGRGATVIERWLFDEELDRAGAPRPFGAAYVDMIGTAIRDQGTDAQRKRFLRPLLSADEVWCQGFSEPGAGSDLAGLATRAERYGDEYVVTGQKVWTSYADTADWCFLLCRTEMAEPKHRGLSLLLVDMKSPGIEVKPLRQMTGSAEFCEVFFDGVRVPVENLLGEPGAGWHIAMGILAHERGPVWTFGFQRGIRRSFERLVALAKRRSLDGAHVSDRLLRQRLAQAYIEVDLLRLFGYRSLTRLLKTGKPGSESSMEKVLGSETDQRLHELALEIGGPYAALSHGPFAAEVRAFVEQALYSRSETIMGGTSEIQRNVIAQRILGLPR